VILPDVNVLVFAFRREAPDHEGYARWLEETVGGADDLAIVDSVLLGAIRVVTNPRIFDDPAPTALALEFAAALRGAPRARPIESRHATWMAFERIVAADRQLRGNLVPDAWLAATAISHGCRLATPDRGFARFADLDWFDPVQASA
jgi:toxin-antitoxin system PIN domain toxin